MAQLLEAGVQVAHPCCQLAGPSRTSFRPHQALLVRGMSTHLAAFDTDTSTRVVRRGPPRVKGSPITSVQLTSDERRLLERVADAEAVSFGEVWRRALRVYAAQQGLLGEHDQEVCPAT